VVLTVVGTLAGVIAAIMAVLQLRRTPVSPRREVIRSSGDAGVPAAPEAETSKSGIFSAWPKRRRTPSGTATRVGDRAGSQPVSLHPPTGRLDEVRGRVELLGLLTQLLADPHGRFHVLAGLGGVGKTTVALALAAEARAGGGSVWWVSGADAASVTEGLLAVAMSLGTAPAEVQEARAGRRHPADVVWAALDKQTGWLLVIDNADDPSALVVSGCTAADGTGWLRPTHHGLVLVTSRMADPGAWGWHGQVHLVECLGEDDGAQVLVDLAPHAGTLDKARSLSRRLGGLPLALHHAGSYLRSPFAAERSFASYQDGLDDRFPVILGAGEDPRSAVASTWEVSLDALAANGMSQARPLLRVLSCFAPSVEIGPILVDYAILARECGDDQDDAEVRAGLDALRAVGLIEARFDSDAQVHDVVIHPLIATASRMHLSAETTGTAAWLLQSATASLRPERDWPLWFSILPHLRSVLGLAPAAFDDRALALVAEAAARVCYALAWSGAHAAAAELAGISLGHADRLGPQHPAILSLCFQRAMSARFQGQYREAEAQLREVLEAQRQVLGADAPATLDTEQELARAMANLGRYAESESACRAVLEARVRILGPEDQDTLITQHYLARAVAEQGRYAESETAYRELQKTTQRILGPAHPFSLMTRNYLAAQFNNQQRYETAEAVLRSLLDDWLRWLGSDYTYVLDVRYELGRAIAGQARNADAELHFRQLLDDELRIRGPEHPHTLLTSRDLARVIGAQGHHSEAEIQLRKVWEAQSRILGEAHPRTLMTLYYISLMFASMGRKDEAARILRSVFASQTEALGPQHPDTLSTKQILSELGLPDR
jgi:Tetratricopeptide repeat